MCSLPCGHDNEEQLKKYEADDDKQFEIDGKSKNGYAWKQDMRRLETALREQKRIKVAAQADGDKALVKECNAKIKAYQAKYEQISEVTGIRTDPSRITIPRQPKTVNEVLTSVNSGGIIDIENESGEQFTSSSKFSVKKGLTESREFVSKIQSLTDDKDLQREFAEKEDLSFSQSFKAIRTKLRGKSPAFNFRYYGKNNN